MNIADLQESPSGKPWEADWVRDWEPAPFDEDEYERFAERAARQGRRATEMSMDDPLPPPAVEGEPLMRNRLVGFSIVVLLAGAALGVAGRVDLQDPALVEAEPIPAFTTTTTSTTTTTTAPVIEAATVTAAAERIIPQITIAPPPPAPTPGECDSWAAEFDRRGATTAEVDFFVRQRILWRETRCGLDTYNEASGDTGICQINPVHNRSGYFGGVEFGEGGWLHELHGLRTRQDHASLDWVDACITLYRVCGTRPWSPPYGCANRPLNL